MGRHHCTSLCPMSQHLHALTFTQVVSFQSEHLGTDSRWPGTGRFRLHYLLLNSQLPGNDAPQPWSIQWQCVSGCQKGYRQIQFIYPP